MFFKRFQEDIDAFLARDPAARSRLEVVLCYPGFHAVLFHRASRGAWRHGWRLLGRFISHVGKILTGIEIHPAAQIGRVNLALAAVEPALGAADAAKIETQR